MRAVIQFYNNPSCELGSAGFQASVREWSAGLAAGGMATKPRMYVGAPGYGEAGPAAFASLGGAGGIKGVVESVWGLLGGGGGELGGVMFWE